MAYEPIFQKPFVYLPDEEIYSLANPQHIAPRRIYLDCLSLLNDMLVEFCSTPSQPQLGFQDIRKLLIDYLNMLVILRPSLHENLISNKEIAFDLREEFSRPTRTVTSYQAHLYVDRYIDDLLKQYRLLRYPPK
ncbi:MAG: hypothetical protein ACJ74J_10025 [Blastocatellia bacterium]